MEAISRWTRSAGPLNSTRWVSSLVCAVRMMGSVKVSIALVNTGHRYLDQRMRV